VLVLLSMQALSCLLSEDLQDSPPGPRPPSANDDLGFGLDGPRPSGMPTSVCVCVCESVCVCVSE